MKRDSGLNKVAALRLLTLPSTTAGNSIHIVYKNGGFSTDRIELADAAAVEIVITTSTAELPGICGSDGLKRQFAPCGRPEHTSCTAPPNEDPGGFGAMVS